MFKLIFFNQNLNSVKKLYNNIFGSFKNLQLVGIASNENELKELNKNFSANMIVINSNDISSNHIKNLLENFKVKITFTDKVIISPNKFTIFISKNLEIPDLKRKLSNFFAKIDENIISKKVYNLLINSNFNFKLNGTTYLLHSIVYSYINSDKKVVNNLEKNVYPHIAKKFQVSTSNIKWSIIRSINNYYDTNSLGLIEKPTPKTLISEFLGQIT